MPIDANIYGNIKPFEAPSVADSAGKAMNLSSLMMQQKRAQQQMSQEDEQFKNTQHLQRASVYGNALDSLSGMNPEQRAQAWPKVKAELVSLGAIKPEDAPDEHDEGFYRSTLSRFYQSKEGIEKQLNMAKIGEMKSVEAKNYAQAKFDKNPASLPADTRLAKMGGEVKQKVGFLTGGLQALTRYENSYLDGGRQGYITPQTPILGKFTNSTPIDESRLSMEEAIGRLASGGAINKGEEDRFRAMIPTAADDDKSAARKLVTLRKEMESKLLAYGFKTEELPAIGYKPEELGYGLARSSDENRGLYKDGQKSGFIRNAVANEPKRPSFDNMSDEELKKFLGGK